MNGLASITPKGFQTPPQNQGLGQLMGGPKPTVREQMAIEVVNDDIEPLDLDPKLEAALKLGEAKELLQSANKVLAPNPANIVQQLQQEVPAGIAALTARMQGAPQGLPRPMPRQTPPPRPMPPGIMGMAQQMAAANQQGRRAPMPQRPPMPMQNAPQRAPAPRPPMAGGLPQLPSNLPRAAQGGIVAFKDGGFPDLSGDGKVTRKDILMGRGVVSKAQGGPLSEADSYMSAQAVLNNPNSTDQEKAFARATLDSLRPIQEGGNMTMDQYAAMMQEVSRRQQGGMAGGGIVGFSNGQMVRGAGRRAQSREEEEEEKKRAARIAARNNRYVELIAAGVPPEEATVMASITEYDPTGEISASVSTQPGQEVITTQVEEEEEESYPPQRLLPPDEVEELSEKVITDPNESESVTTLLDAAGVDSYEIENTPLEESVEKGVTGRLGRDATEEMKKASDRVTELTGLDTQRAAQRSAEQARKALREERFSPDEKRRRLLRDALLGTAEQGLGGFARGMRDAENKIYAEELEAAQEDVATMDKITDTFQQLGMSKFEAEQNTLKLIEDGINSGLSAGATLANALRQAELTARQQELTLAGTLRGQDVQMAIAKIQQENSEFSQKLNILIAEETANNPTASQQEIRSAALQKIFDQDLRGRLAYLGIQESDLQRKAFADAIKSAVDMVSGDMTLITNPEARKATIFELARQISTMQGFSGQTQNSPTREEFITKSLEANPDYSREEIIEIYNRTYGGQ
jgi:hypothetical protein